MPKPREDESKEDFMDRCTSEGNSEEVCERIWEDEGPEDSHAGRARRLEQKAPKLLTVRMKAEDTAEVLLYDQIGRDPFFGEGVDAKGFREQIRAVKAKTINLRINSPGGSVLEAAAILQALDEHPARIEVDVDGVAASAASVVMMAGDRIRVASNALVMIHNPMAGVLGDAADMRHTADLLDKVKGQIIDSYKRKSGKSRTQISDWMDAETWFTGREAVEAGLADEATAPVQVAALARLVPLAARLGAKKAPDLKVSGAEEARARRETERRRKIAASL